MLDFVEIRFDCLTAGLSSEALKIDSAACVPNVFMPELLEDFMNDAVSSRLTSNTSGGAEAPAVPVAAAV